MHVIQHAHSTTGENTVAPGLLLSRDALAKIATYVTVQRATEINGFAYVGYHDGDFYVTTGDDVFITKQTVTTVSAEVTGTECALAFERAAREGRSNDLRLQWHSHPGAAYFSDTDRNNIEEFGGCGIPWLISLVTNRQGDLCARFDLFRPYRIGTEIAVVSYESVSDDVATVVTDQIKQLVTVRKLVKQPSDKH